MKDQFLKIITFFDLLIEKISVWLVVASIFLMLSFSLFGIVVRWFEVSFLWLDPLVRHIVFASTFFGGVIATGKGRNISIDLLEKSLVSRGYHKAQRLILVIANFVATGTLIWLAHPSFDFVSLEFQYGKPPFLGIESGYLVAIIPVGFLIIAYRFFYIFLKHLLLGEVKQ